MGEVIDSVDVDVLVPGTPPSAYGYTGLNPRQEVEDGLVIDRDVAVTLRDGVTIYLDVYRPEGVSEALPAILLWSVYGKHGFLQWSAFPPSIEVDLSAISKHTLLECPDPVAWCARGYAVVTVDPRGAFGSEGDMTLFSKKEGSDAYDTIEFIADQPWCTGKIGMAGMSYFAIAQWFAGATRPPHLAALLPYDGVSDPYRELAFHGGIPNLKFMESWGRGLSTYSNNRAEDWVKATEVHPLLDEYWESKQPELERIEVPTYVVASWTDHGVHTRGSLEAYKRLGSPVKFLEVHGRKKWSRFYWKESFDRQLAFFDRFLQDKPNEVDSWPAVRIEVRERYYEGTWRDEHEWPLARTQYRALYLDGKNASATSEQVNHEASVQYDSTSTENSAVFGHRFVEDTELTGHAKLKLWVSAEGSDDMDLFVAIQKVDKQGDLVPFPYYTIFEDGPVASGWLRVSHRELDEQLSTPQQPVHPHLREERLAEGEIVPVEIELWPSSTLFHSGETLRVVVQGSDIQVYPEVPFVAGHPDTRNAGRHVIHTGGRYDSHLLLPVIPK
jgi:predicted acyl esterase